MADEGAVTQYVPLAATATGPTAVIAVPGTAPSAAALPARAEQGLRDVPPPRAAELRAVATSPVLGAPGVAPPSRAAAAPGAAPGDRVAAGPSLPSAIGTAFGDAGAGALLVTLALGVGIGAAVRRGRRC